jgi:energy-coupling factor transporter ATP-binding protein EcfA2
MSTQSRLEAFLTEGIEIFSSVQQGQHLWQPDPFDVETLNAPARRVFKRLVDQASARPGPNEGRLLLLRGNSGSGKTHLVRAFRNLVHGKDQGFAGYMPMTVDVAHYDRYILSNLIDSLDRPYHVSQGEDSGLMRLSDALMQRCTSAFAPLIPAEKVLESDELDGTIHMVVDELLSDAAFRNVEVDLLRALLYLQRRDPRINRRIFHWLRCEDLSAMDRKVIGELIPRTADDAPARMVEHLGRLMGAMGKALVLCVDQVEDVSDFEQRPQMENSFRRAMNSLVAIASKVPNAVMVICCLSDYWEKIHPLLNQSVVDRLVNAPEPVDLEGTVTADTARSIAARRLRSLYEQRGVGVDPAAPTWPIPAERFEVLGGQRARDVLNECQRYRDRAIEQGRLPETFPLPRKGAPALPDAKPPLSLPPPADLEQAWVDFRSSFKASLPAEDADVAALLAWAIEAGGDELGGTTRFVVKPGEEESLEVTVQPGGSQLFIALCERNPQGGALGRQMAEALRAAASKVPVFVRTSDFPSSTGTTVAEQLTKLFRKGGRRVVVGDSELRELVALRAFREKNAGQSALTAWSRSAKPITRLKAVGDMLGLERGREQASKPDELPFEALTPPLPPQVPQPPPRDVPMGPLSLGTSSGVFSQPVPLEKSELTRHSAFLGGTGSGKTTLALNILEQLLLQGIPAILVDRKGDLATYASEKSWQEPLDSPVLLERRRLLRERVDVALYTPGRSDGRPLAIPIVPRGLEALPEEERDQGVQQAADAIAGMLEYKGGKTDKAAHAMLGQALRLLVQRPFGKELTLEMLHQFIASQDASLLQETSGLPPKTFAKLAQDLEVLRLNIRPLLAAGGERLDMEELLGRGASRVPGRTRLSIISTKFLGDNARVLFWVSQLLLETNRWASQHPSSQIQAALLFDEADLYLPATSIPATKQPMENLLRRARSAGVGVMLATQSPGDLDYKCRENVRTWFVGSVKEERALKKLKPMFSEARVDAGAKLPPQKMGQFHVLREGQVQQLRAERSVVRTEQLSEDEILRLARGTLERARRTPLKAG